MKQINQSTARNVMVFITQAAAPYVGLTGASLTITLSKDGAAFASATPTVTERGNGWYNLALTSSHTDTLGDLAVYITALLANAFHEVYSVVAAPALSSQVDALEGDTTAIKAKTDSLTFTVSGNVDSNLRRVNSVEVSGNGQAGNEWGPA